MSSKVSEQAPEKLPAPETLSKPYASKPDRAPENIPVAMPTSRLQEPVGLSSFPKAWPAQSAADLPTEPNPLDRLYRKYLDTQTGQDATSAEERERAQAQRHAIRNDIASGLPKPSADPASCVDAEEVIILEDYDDRYDD
jgi:hypothetical protein